MICKRLIGKDLDGRNGGVI